MSHLPRFRDLYVVFLYAVGIAVAVGYPAIRLVKLDFKRLHPAYGGMGGGTEFFGRMEITADNVGR